jgi:hypothetical protein
MEEAPGADVSMGKGCHRDPGEWAAATFGRIKSIKASREIRAGAIGRLAASCAQQSSMSIQSESPNLRLIDSGPSGRGGRSPRSTTEGYMALSKVSAKGGTPENTYW